MSKAVLDLRFKDRKVGSLAYAVLATVLLAPAQPASTPVLRSFDRVLLLEETAETSAGVSVGDVNGDGLPDIVLGKGRHWPLFNRVLLNDGYDGFIASNLGTAPDRTYSAALADVDGDSHLDIVVSNDAPDHKLVYLNDGKGHFTWPPTAATIRTWWTENPVKAPKSPLRVTSALMMAKGISRLASHCQPNQPPRS